MADFSEKRVYDYIWQRLAGFALGTGASTTVVNPLVEGVVISEPQTLYVETTGNDSNNGSASFPFATIQGAFEWLRQFTIRAPVTISVGLGTFDGFCIPQLKLESAGRPSNVYSGGSVTVQGTLVLVDSGTASSGSASILNDVSKNWGSLAGRLLKQGSNYNIIATNTSTSITFLRASLGTGAYEIYDYGTVIRPNCPIVGVTGSACITSDNTGGRDNSTVAAVTSRWLHLDGGLASGSTSLLVSSGQSVGALFNLTECFLNIPSAGLITTAINLGSNGGSSASITLTRTYLNLAKASSIGVVLGAARLRTIQSCFVGGDRTQTGVQFFGPDCAIQDSIVAWYSNLGTVFAANRTEQSPLVGGSVSGTYLNNATVLSATSGHWRVLDSKSNIPAFPVASSGNTSFVTVSGPAKVQVASNIPSGLATTEITVNGATSSLTTMRANTPRVFPTSPDAFGGCVYE